MRPEKNVTWEDMQEMRGNTKFWSGLFPLMTSEAFIRQAQHYLDNCGHDRHSNTVYDCAVLNIVVPEALKRIDEMDTEILKRDKEIERLKSRISVLELRLKIEEES